MYVYIRFLMLVCFNFNFNILIILVKQRLRNSIRYVKTLPGTDIDSDHNLLVAG